MGASLWKTYVGSNSKFLWSVFKTVNDTKTRVCKLPEEQFDFLGYTFGRCYSSNTGRAYLGTTPSKKRVQRICKAISQETLVTLSPRAECVKRACSVR